MISILFVATKRLNNRFVKWSCLYTELKDDYANVWRARDSGTRRHAPRFSRRARASRLPCISLPPSTLTPALCFLTVSFFFSPLCFSHNFSLSRFLGQVQIHSAFIRFHFASSILFIRRDIFSHRLFSDCNLSSSSLTKNHHNKLDVDFCIIVINR